MPHRNSLSHEDKVAPLHRGKQHGQHGGHAAELAKASARQGAPEPPPEPWPADEGYTPRHERVLGALADAEAKRDGEAVYLDEISRRAGLPEDETRDLLHDLVTVHRLVTELIGADVPDLGPRFELKPRL